MICMRRVLKWIGTHLRLRLTRSSLKTFNGEWPSSRVMLSIVKIHSVDGIMEQSLKPIYNKTVPKQSLSPSRSTTKMATSLMKKENFTVLQINNKPSTLPCPESCHSAQPASTVTTKSPNLRSKPTTLMIWFLSKLMVKKYTHCQERGNSQSSISRSLTILAEWEGLIKEYKKCRPESTFSSSVATSRPWETFAHTYINKLSFFWFKI